MSAVTPFDGNLLWGPRSVMSDGGQDLLQLPQCILKLFHKRAEDLSTKEFAQLMEFRNSLHIDVARFTDGAQWMEKADRIQRRYARHVEMIQERTAIAKHARATGCQELTCKFCKNAVMVYKKRHAFARHLITKHSGRLEEVVGENALDPTAKEGLVERVAPIRRGPLLEIVQNEVDSAVQSIAVTEPPVTENDTAKQLQDIDSIMEELLVMYPDSKDVQTPQVVEAASYLQDDSTFAVAEQPGNVQIGTKESQSELWRLLHEATTEEIVVSTTALPDAPSTELTQRLGSSETSSEPLPQLPSLASSEQSEQLPESSCEVAEAVTPVVVLHRISPAKVKAAERKRVPYLRPDVMMGDDRKRVTPAVQLKQMMRQIDCRRDVNSTAKLRCVMETHVQSIVRKGARLDYTRHLQVYKELTASGKIKAGDRKKLIGGLKDFPRFKSFCDKIHASTKAPESMLNDFTRFSRVDIRRVLSLMIQDFGYRDPVLYDDQFLDQANLFIMNFVSKIGVNMVLLSKTMRRSSASPGDLGILVGIESNYGSLECQSEVPSTHFLIQNGLPSSDRIHKCLFHYTFLQLEVKPNTLEDAVRMLNAGDPGLTTLYTSKVVKNGFDTLRVVTYRLLRNMAKNISERLVEDDLNLRDDPLSWAYFKKIFDPQLYEFTTCAVHTLKECDVRPLIQLAGASVNKSRPRKLCAGTQPRGPSQKRKRKVVSKESVSSGDESE